MKNPENKNLPRLETYVEFNLRKQIKEFPLGKGNHDLRIQIYPCITPANTCWVEGKFVINGETCAISFNGHFSDEERGVETVCSSLLGWLSSNQPYCYHFTDDFIDYLDQIAPDLDIPHGPLAPSPSPENWNYSFYSHYNLKTSLLRTTIIYEI